MPHSGIVDLQFLRANPLIEQDIDTDGIDRAFDEAVARNGWLIFYTYDVSTTPSFYGCSPSLLRHAMEAASRREIPILSIAGRCGKPAHNRVSFNPLISIERSY